MRLKVGICRFFGESGVVEVDAAAVIGFQHIVHIGDLSGKNLRVGVVIRHHHALDLARRSAGVLLLILCLHRGEFDFLQTVDPCIVGAVRCKCEVRHHCLDSVGIARHQHERHVGVTGIPATLLHSFLFLRGVFQQIAEHGAELDFRDRQFLGQAQIPFHFRVLRFRKACIM